MMFPFSALCPLLFSNSLLTSVSASLRRSAETHFPSAPGWRGPPVLDHACNMSMAEAEDRLAFHFNCQVGGRAGRAVPEVG